MMKSKRNLFLFILAVGIVLNCASVQQLMQMQRPGLEVDRVRISGLSFENIDLLFDLKVNNPNAVGINLAAFDYDFLLSGNSFVNGRQDKGLNIEANGESIVQVPINLKFTDIFQTYQNLKNNDSTDYELRAGFAFDIPVLGDVRVPVTQRGVLPMVKLPNFSIQSLKLDQLTFSGADLTLRVALDNPNAFALNLDKMDYQFAVNGKSWISGVSQNVKQVNQKGMGLIDIPISLNFMEVGQSVYRLLTGSSQLDYHFNGSFDMSASLPQFGTINFPVQKAGTISRSDKFLAALLGSAIILRSQG